MGCTGSFIDAVALGEQRPVHATVALIGRNEAKRAVLVLDVIPAHEALNPSPRLVDGREAAGAVFDAPMFVKAWLWRLWARKVRDRFRGRYSVLSTE